MHRSHCIPVPPGPLCSRCADSDHAIRHDASACRPDCPLEFHPWSAAILEWQLELTLTGPGTLSQLYLTFDGTDWNVPHIAEWTSPSSMSTATVSVSVTGTNAYQYQLAFVNPIQLAGMASFQLVTLPPYLLASSMNAMALRTVLWPTPEAEVCVKADVQTVPTSMCFHTDAQPAFTSLDNLGAGLQRIVFTAVNGSGADATDFAPYAVEINVLGWMRMVPADGSGSVRNPATNSWNATSSSCRSNPSDCLQETSTWRFARTRLECSPQARRPPLSRKSFD